VSVQLGESAKSPGDDSSYMHMLCQQKFDVSAITELIQQKNTTHFDPTPTACGLIGIWFLSRGSGAHFDCCAYIIDLTRC